MLVWCQAELAAPKGLSQACAMLSKLKAGAVRCSARALSKYTDMVDSVTRQQLDRLAEASNDARLRLRQWELPECLQVGTVGVWWEHSSAMSTGGGSLGAARVLLLLLLRTACPACAACRACLLHTCT